MSSTALTSRRLTILTTLMLLSACSGEEQPSKPVVPQNTGGQAAGSGGTAGAGGAPVPNNTGGSVSAGSGGQGTSGAGGAGGTAGGPAGGTAGSSGGGGAGGGDADPPPSTLPPTDDYSDYGPFDYIDESGTGPDGTYTIVRPETLGEDGFLHAPVTFGPGIDGAPSSMMNLLERVASHGFVVISKELNHGPNNPENNRRMTDGLDWLIEQNTTAGSVFQGKLAVGHAVSMGYSVGATASVDIAGHDAIVTAVAIHGHGAEPVEDATGRTFLLMGGSQDLDGGESWMAPTYAALEHQTLFTLLEGADHGYPGGSVNGVQAGLEAPVAIAWIRYWVYKDQGAKMYFYGDDCIVCMAPWTDTERKHWE
jgi:dienelactone hydrolase